MSQSPLEKCNCTCILYQNWAAPSTFDASEILYLIIWIFFSSLYRSFHTCHFTNLSPLHTWWWLDLALNSHMPIITHFCNNQLVCWNLATFCICSHTFYSVQWYTIGRTNFILFLVSKEQLWTSFHKTTLNKHGHNTI